MLTSDNASLHSYCSGSWEAGARKLSALTHWPSRCAVQNGTGSFVPVKRQPRSPFRQSPAACPGRRRQDRAPACRPGALPPPQQYAPASNSPSALAAAEVWRDFAAWPACAPSWKSVWSTFNAAKCTQVRGRAVLLNAAGAARGPKNCLLLDLTLPVEVEG